METMSMMGHFIRLPPHPLLRLQPAARVWDWDWDWDWVWDWVWVWDWACANQSRRKTWTPRLPLW